MVFLPGLGADQRLFFEQKKVFGEAYFPEWIRPQARESLADYARRWSKDFQSEEHTLVGMSFGSQMAIELSRHLSVRKIISISGFSHSSQVGARFKSQVRLGLMAPDILISWILKRHAVPYFCKKEGLSFEQAELLREMTESLDFDFFRWAAKAATQWEMDFVPSCPIVRIHGECDDVVPRGSAPIQYPLPDAKHLIQFTHAREVNEIIAQESS